ncbi:MAG: hypothetical protein JWP09_822 [Candidatus Taylorbacteria bacterium]|nr:hypothetical protein [Candidatus Taylorbacteria bacterium]
MDIKYKNKIWTTGVNRNLSFLHQCLSAGFTHTIDFGAPQAPLSGSITSDGTKTDIFYEKNSLDIFGKGLVKMSHDPKKIRALQTYYKKFAQEFLLSLQRLNKNTNSRNLELFFRQYSRFCSGLLITRVMGIVDYSALRDKLKDLNIDDIDSIISYVSYPEKNTPLTLSRIELLKIASLKELDREKKLRTWLKRFQHIPVNFCEDPWTMADALQQLKEISGKDPEASLRKMLQNHQDKLRNKKDLLRKIKNTHVLNLANALGICTTLNEFRKNIFCKVSLEYRSVFLKIAKLGGSEDWRDCFYLTPDEMKGLMAGKKILIPKIKMQRKVVGRVVDKKGSMSFIKAKDLNIFPNQESHNSSDQISTKGFELKGIVANKGKVIGPVKIVFHRGEFEKFKKGDILVSSMTSVDFVPIMEMAAAFVTNEGGITSHASIVAREMNKPCIIGTKIATMVFKDGDMVEVDAEKGVIRKLS